MTGYYDLIKYLSLWYIHNQEYLQAATLYQINQCPAWTHVPHMKTGS